MTYEPKVGDEVVLRGRVHSLKEGRALVRVNGRFEYTFETGDLDLAPDLGESELRGQVSGPWAVELAEALTKAEARIVALEAADSLWVKTFQDRFAENRARIEALEASARVRDVPATMVNLAHRVQSTEGQLKTLSLNFGERLFKIEEEMDARAAIPLPPLPASPSWAADEVRDAQGRVLKSKTLDVDPQGDWSTARANVAPINPDALEIVLRTNAELRERASAAQKATEQIRAANENLMADVQRAEARLDAIDDALRVADAGRVPNMDEYHRGWYSCVEMARAALSAGRKDPAHGAHAQASE